MFAQVHQSCRAQTPNCSYGENALFTLPPVSVLNSCGSLVWNVSHFLLLPGAHETGKKSNILQQLLLSCVITVRVFLPFNFNELSKLSPPLLLWNNLTLFLLPYPQAVRPSGCLPMLVFVNSKSGDNQVGHYRTVIMI